MVATGGIVREVQCKRCGNRTQGLGQAPLPGVIGQRVLDGTCAACWQEWIEAQVILMNENRLSPAVPEHYERLMREMETFLRLGEG